MCAPSMPLASLPVALLLGLSACDACGGAPKPAPAKDPGSEVERPTDTDAPSPHAPATRQAQPELPPARVVAVQGSVKLSDGEQAVAIGSPLGAEQTIELADAASLTLDMPAGARVQLRGPAVFSVGRDRLRQLLVGYGGLHVQLAPEGDTRRLFLRVGTPELSVELVGHAQAWIAVAERRGSFVGLLSGTATVEGRERRSLGAGQAVRARAGGDRLDEVPLTARRVEVAVEQANALLAALPERPSDRAALLKGLDATVAELRALQARGRELRRDRDGAEANAPAPTQQELVDYAQRMFVVRRSALVAWERVQAAALLGGGLPDHAQRAEALRALIGAVEP